MTKPPSRYLFLRTSWHIYEAPHFHYRFQLPDPLRFDSEGFPKFGVPPTGHGALIELPRTRLVRNTV